MLNHLAHEIYKSWQHWIVLMEAPVQSHVMLDHWVHEDHCRSGSGALCSIFCQTYYKLLVATDIIRCVTKGSHCYTQFVPIIKVL